LPWNICPFCGTPAPGMRREASTIEDAVKELQTEDREITPPGEN